MTMTTGVPEAIWKLNTRLDPGVSNPSDTVPSRLCYITNHGINSFQPSLYNSVGSGKIIAEAAVKCGVFTQALIDLRQSGLRMLPSFLFLLITNTY
ncbi:hypothetical protein ACTXT7_004116 [Hymenolepis weldensis]